MVAGRHGDSERRAYAVAVLSAGGQKSLVAAKLVETASRGAFVVTGTYSLPLADAGRFGVMVTLVGLFAFVAGFERQIDLQRRLVGEDAATIHAQFSDALRLYLINHALLAPALLWSVHVLCNVELAAAVGLVVIVAAEQLANQTYQVALLSARFQSLIFVAAAKNAALLVFLAISWRVDGVQFQAIILAWLIVSLLFIAVCSYFWWRASSPTEPARPVLAIGRQYTASGFHFLLGLVAIMSLQADRLLVASLLTAEQVGTFYRNVVLTSVGYIIFNVVFVGRLMPQVFLRAKSDRVSVLMIPLWKEWRLVAVIAVVGTAALFGLPHLYAPLDPAQLDVRPSVLLWLVLAFIVRAAADLAGIVINARHMESSLLVNQAVALVVGLAATASLAYGYGPSGAASGGVVLSGAYLLLNYRTLKKMESSL